MRKPITMVLFALSLGGAAFADVSVQATHSDIPYSEGYERSKFDIWIPQSESPTPLVLFFHGGGFRGGDKSNIPFRADFTALPAQGVAFASVGYPLMQDLKEVPDDETARKMAIGKEIEKVIPFIQKNAKRYNVDPSRIIVSGSSAGCAGAQYLAYIAKADVIACIGIQQAGIADHMKQFIRADSAPLILYTSSGSNDRVHHPDLARSLKKHCDKVGATCWLYGSPASGLPQVPNDGRFVAHAMEIIGGIRPKQTSKSSPRPLSD
jgi:carboxylesterase type B